MKHRNRARRRTLSLASGSILLVSAGCDHDMARELVTLSAAYIGDVASVVTTDCLADMMGVELQAVEHEQDEHEHEHDEGPLHDYEH